MKRCLFTCLLFAIGLTGFSQSRFPALDKSPMDMSYYPVNYPILKIQDKVSEPLVARVVYSRPQRNGRSVFGELVEYGKVWRIGANEATEIEFFKDVSFGGKPVPKGRYALYAIPELDKWTIILNKDTDTWGSFRYNSSLDILKLAVPVQKMAETLDTLCIFFEKMPEGFALCAAWENQMVTIPVKVSTKTATRKKMT